MNTYIPPCDTRATDAPPEPAGTNEEKLSRDTVLLQCIRMISVFRNRMIIYGMCALGGLTYLSHRSHQHQERTYQAYLQETMTAAQLHEHRQLRYKISRIIGHTAAKRIEFADKDAYLTRRVKRSQPAFKGFDTLIHVRKYNQYPVHFTDDIGMHPRNWIEGEVDRVMYTNTVTVDDIGNGNEYRVGGSFGQPGNDRDQTMVLHDIRHDNERYVWVVRELINTFEHELCHANDWIHDRDLNVTQRFQLIDGVLQRMRDEDAFDNYGEYIENNVPYWKLFLCMDESDDEVFEQSKVHRAAIEYWAEICSAFFDNPDRLREEYPADFSLVQEQVKINDANFDIFRHD